MEIDLSLNKCVYFVCHNEANQNVFLQHSIIEHITCCQAK